MNFEQLKRRVDRAEQVVEGRILQTTAARYSLQARWREAWTPTRIVIVGLLTGFVSGKAQPERALRQVGKFANPRMMQLITSLSGLVASLQTAYAAATAKDAADTADDAADDAATTARHAAATAAGTSGPGAGGASGGTPGGRPGADRDPTAAAQAAKQAQQARASVSRSAAADATASDTSTDGTPVDGADDETPPRPRSDRSRVEATPERQPAPAEAATDLSER